MDEQGANYWIKKASTPILYTFLKKIYMVCIGTLWNIMPLTKRERVTLGTIEQIDLRLKQETSIDFSAIKVDKQKFESYLCSSMDIYERSGYYKNNAKRKEKFFEHFITSELLSISPEKVCMDIGACASPYAEIMRRAGVTVYKHDLIFKTNLKDFIVGGWSNRIDFASETLDFAFAHCAIDNFEGNCDTELMVEVYRMLKPGGKFAIIPLYLRTRHENVVSITARGVDYDNAAVIIRELPFGLRFGRHYSVNTFVDRLIKKGPFEKAAVLRITNLYEIDKNLYCNYVAVFTKL